MATPTLKLLDLLVLRSLCVCSAAVMLMSLSAPKKVPCLPDTSEPLMVMLDALPAPVATIFTLPPAFTCDLAAVFPSVCVRDSLFFKLLIKLIILHKYFD